MRELGGLDAGGILRSNMSRVPREIASIYLLTKIETYFCEGHRANLRDDRQYHGSARKGQYGWALVYV